jgi:uncharacterized damage-inducible protein DinB
MAGKKIAEYIHQSESIFNGTPWYGAPMTEILKKISPAMAFKTPFRKAHSIAQLVAHVVYWRQSLIRRLEGDWEYRGSMQSEDNWPANAKLKRTGWKSILASLNESQQRLVSLLDKQSDTLLRKKYSEKSTYRDVVVGIIQHDLYHLGQIAYLKSLFEKKGR